MIGIALSFVMGTAPWCTADNYQNLACWYYDYNGAAQACQMTMGCVAVVMNPYRGY